MAKHVLSPEGLDTCEGVAYLTDTAGMIISVGPSRWTTFAQENGAPELTPDSVYGTDLFLLIDDGPLREFYQDLHRSVLSGSARRAFFTYRCDAPDKRRLMRMTISLVAGRAVLYESVLLKEESRAPFAYLRHGAAAEGKRLADPQVLQVCGLCARVSPSGPADGEWTQFEDYLAGPAPSPFAPKYTICSSCGVDPVRAE